MEHVEKSRTNFAWALNIFQNLTQHGYDVFIDFSGINSGDFESVILGNITARAHFLVLLTPSALEHCYDPADWLRREIETALRSQRNIVPLMMEGFDFGTPKIANQLTGKLAALKKYNGLSIPPEYFLEAMGRLRDRFLNVPLTAVLHPVPASVKQAATEQKAAARAAPAVQEEELTAQQWFERGLAATDVDVRLRFYSEAIRLKPDDANAFKFRGLARYDKGDIEGAVQDYTEAIRLKPDDTTRSTFGAVRVKRRAIWREHYRITTKRSGSNLTMPQLSTVGVLRARRKVIWREHYRITTKPSGSDPSMPQSSPVGASREK
jgi:hypothetical protein